MGGYLLSNNSELLNQIIDDLEEIALSFFDSNSRIDLLDYVETLKGKVKND